MFFGIFGIDRFYLGYYATGVLKLLTLGGFGVWALIDVLVLLAGRRRAKDGSHLKGYERAKVVSWVVFGILVLQLVLFFTPVGMRGRMRGG
jgi:TM2 domain-containing membrane protein YozV